jgi:PAS domain S-box-containing protein
MSEAADSAIGPDPAPAIGPQGAADILEGMSDAYVAIDRDWRYTYVNAAAERVLNRHRDDILGRTVREVFSEPIAGFENGCRRAMDAREAVSFEH